MTMGSGWSRGEAPGWYGRGGQAPDPARQHGWMTEYLTGTYGNPVARAKLRLASAQTANRAARSAGVRWSRRRPLRREIRAARAGLAAAYEEAGQ